MAMVATSSRVVVITDAVRGRTLRTSAAALDLPVLDPNLRPDLLVDAIAERWDVRVAILRSQRRGDIELELLAGGGRLPDDWRWREAVPPIAGRSAWEIPGWIKRSTRLIDAVLERIGRHRLGPPRQIRHTLLAALLRVPTDRGAVWFKALPPMFARESATIRQLRRRAPQNLPIILAEGPDWWIAEELPEEQWAAAASAFVKLADVQILSMPDADLFLDAGCARFDLSDLPTAVRLLASRSDLVDAASAEALASNVGALDDMCGDILGQGFPDCLVHGDFHPGNRRWTGTEWIIYDWTDARIACPFLDLSLAPRFERPQELADLRDAFSARWKTLAADAAVNRAMAVAAPVGAAFQAVNYGRIADGLPARPIEALKFELREWAACFGRTASDWRRRNKTRRA